MINKATTTIYLSGPFTYSKDDKSIEYWFNDLTSRGWKVLYDMSLSPQKTWEEQVRTRIRILSMCTHVCFLTGFENNKETLLEKHIAEQLGMPWCLVDRWCMDTPF
jgi:hypothetical protein